MRPVDDRAYRLGLGLATLLIAIQLADKESDERRHARKHAVLSDKWTVLRATFREELAHLQGYGGTGPSVRQLADTFADVTSPWTADRRRRLLIDVLMGDPFAPYELKVAVSDADAALGALARPLGLDEAEIGDLWRVWSAARAAYRPSRWRRPDGTATSIPALTTGEFVLPPAPGEAARADGAPDVLTSDHHMALLAGGALSATDATMAGGLWLVDPTGPDGAVREPAERARMLLALDVAQARAEVVKLQMSYTLVVQPGHVPGVSPAVATAELRAVRDRVVAHLDAEQERNDEHARRVRTLEELVRALDMAAAHLEQAADSRTVPAKPTPAPHPAT